MPQKACRFVGQAFRLALTVDQSGAVWHKRDNGSSNIGQVCAPAVLQPEANPLDNSNACQLRPGRTRLGMIRNLGRIG